MMAQKLRSRRTKTIETPIDNNEPIQESFQQKFAKYIVQLSVLGLISIIIFYGVRFVYIELFEPGTSNTNNNNKTLRDTILSGDIDDNDDIVWVQPKISTKLIPQTIITHSPTDECHEINPKWKMQKYTIEEAMDILKNELKINDDDIKKIAEPMDLFKFIIINKYGGFYLNGDIECKSNLTKWIRNYYEIRHIHYNNYILSYELLKDNDLNNYVDLDMIIALESGNPFEFANWAFFSKPNNPILQFIIDSYLDFIEGNRKYDDDTDKKVNKNKPVYIGPHIFTEAIKGFIETFTNDHRQALTFHKFEDDKAHIITLYLSKGGDDDDNDDDYNGDDMEMINIMVVPVPELWRIARRKRNDKIIRPRVKKK